jgi:hypothetical protein
MIKYLGIIGFTKFKLVSMIKTSDDRFEYTSNKAESDQIP